MWDIVWTIINYNNALSVGCVAQWLERRSLTGELSLASARSVADV